MSEIPESQKLTSTSYDDVPYPSHPIAAMHPDHLYSIAKLFRLDAPIPDNASILELGCANGGNVIPLAVQMPNAKIVGVDLSRRQIADGQRTVDALGLTNLKLIAMDFQCIDASFGQFDYILCHGVFSWIPPEAQLCVLQICQDRLSVDGVAYISYNAYPGWFTRGLVRQMMLPYVSQLSDPTSRIQQARALLAFMLQSTEGQNTPYAQTLKYELDLLAKNPESYLFHEHLEENNWPMFFYQFMEMASRYQLQFLGEAILATMITSNLPPNAVESLKKLTTSLVEQSQYMDFATNRMFRQSLLCHQDRNLDRLLNPSRLDGGRFAGRFQVDGANQWNNLNPEVEIVFRSVNGQTIQTKDLAIQAMLFALSEAWPGSLTSSEICDRTVKKLAERLSVGESEQASIANLVNSSMLHLVLRGDVALRFLPDRFVMKVSDKPAVSPLARLQATQGSLLTTQLHTMFNADPLTRMVVPMIDGSRTRESIAEFIGDIARGKVNDYLPENRAINMATVHKATTDKILEQLRRAAMLFA